MNVVVVGCGVRGSIVAALLAGGGVEELSLVDGSLISEEDVASNPLIFTPDLNAGKADALVAKLSLIAPAALAVPFPAELNAENAGAILTGASVVVDCTGVDEVAEALGAAWVGDEGGLIGAPGDYDAGAVDVPRAVEVAAVQAAAALAIRA